jgi:hypothetical protein
MSFSTSAFVYVADGNRIKKTEGGETILYINPIHRNCTIACFVHYGQYVKEWSWRMSSYFFG